MAHWDLRSRRYVSGVLGHCLLLFLIITPCLPSTVEGPAPKRVLLIFPYEFARPATVELHHGFERALTRSFAAPVSVFVEYTRVGPSGPADFDLKLLDWIVYRYSGMKFDALCPILIEGVDLAEHLRDRFWPGTPVVFGVPKSDYLKMAKPRPGSTGIYLDLTEEETIRSAIRMLPETRAMALVGGSAPDDRVINRRIVDFMRKTFPSVALIDVTGVAMEEVVNRVKALPKETIVYRGAFTYDARGRSVVAPDMADILRKASNAPVFSHSLLGFGSGTVGGLMRSFERGGEALGEQTARVLRGERPEQLPVTNVPPIAAVDWRELRKWNIPESRIPAGAEVRFRRLSMWEEHKVAILTASGGLLLQAVLIVFLLIEKRMRRLTEGAASESEDLNRAVLSSLSGRIAILDRRGRVIRVSQNWDLPSSDPPAVPQVGVGGNYLDALRTIRASEPERNAVAECVSAVLRGESEIRVYEYQVTTQDGDMWCEVRVERLDRQEGGAVVTHIDTTTRKQVELDRRRTLDELHHMNRVASVGQLAGSLAHELAQPLASILSNAQAAERFATGPNPDYKEIREALAEIAVDDRRARTIIDRMRAILKKQAVPVQVVDLNQVADDVSRLVRSTALQRRITLIVDLHPEPAVVHGDVVAFQQVLLNLLNNAMDAADQGSASGKFVIIRTSASGTAGEMIVEDSGPGIREEDLARLFESFFTTKPDGLGMGLSICRSIVESLGGRISGENRPSRGAIFRVAIPLNPVGLVQSSPEGDWAKVQ